MLFNKKSAQRGAINLGIYGGAFDPPHRSHEMCIRYALSPPQSLDRVWVLPSGQRVDKPNQLSFDHRMAMAKLAFEDISGVFVGAYESPSYRTGPIYTYDTISILKKKYPNWNFHLIVGSDNADVSSWHEGQALLQLLGSVIVVPRTDDRSSTSVRTGLHSSLPTLNPKVANYIKVHGLYQ